MKKVLVGLALTASVCGMGAVNITSNTTVTDAEVANYVNADIDIAEGATLCFHNLTAAQTFKGKLTGAGAFVVKSDAENKAARITFDGDATGLTGGIFVTNHLITATGPKAIGPSKFTLKMTTANVISYFNGPGEYTCPLDIRVTEGHPYGFTLGEGVVVSGAVVWHQGRICGPGSVTGKFQLIGGVTCYAHAGVRFKGGVEGSQGILTSDSGTFWIDSSFDKISTVRVIKSTVNFGYKNALDPAQTLQVGISWGAWGSFALNGFDQQCGTLTCYTQANEEGRTGFSSTTPATLTIKSQSSDQTLYGNLMGQFSLDFTSSRSKAYRLLLCGTKNDTSGRITVRSGTVAANTNAVFSALSEIAVCGTGAFEACFAQEASGRKWQPSFPSEGFSIRLSEEGKLKIPAGMTWEVDAVFVGDAKLAKGSYTKDSPELAGHIDGDGTLVVLDIDKKTEGRTFTWKGGTNGDALEAAENWKEEDAPVFDGTERLVFGAEGSSAQAVVGGVRNVFAIDFTGNQAFTLSAKDVNAKIVLQQGGFTLTNRLDDTLVKHTVSCPVELGYVPQTWSIGGDTQFDNQASISGPNRVSAEALTIDCGGRILFNADNSQLFPPLVLTNCRSVVAQPHVFHEKGLGSPTRETWVVGCLPRFMTNAKPMTNRVPLRVNCTITGDNLHSSINDDASKYGLYLDAPITFYGTHTGETYLNGNVHYRGGIAHADNKGISLRFPHGNNWVEGDQGFSTTGTITFDYEGVFNLAATNNQWGLLNPYKSMVKLYTANALAVGKPIRLSDSSGAYRGSTSGLDLNGFDQSISRLYTGFNKDQTTNLFATVKSAVPAVLEVAQTGTANDLVAVKFEGAAGLRFNAPGSITFTNHLSETTGILDVEQGTVRFASGSGWVNVTNVVLGAAGTLAVGPGAGATALGPKQGKSAADVSLTPGGVFNIAAGETAAVHSVTQVETAETKRRYLNPGFYGAAGTVGVTHPVDWVQGGGVLQVISSQASGTLFILR